LFALCRKGRINDVGLAAGPEIISAGLLVAKELSKHIANIAQVANQILGEFRFCWYDQKFVEIILAGGIYVFGITLDHTPYLLEEFKGIPVKTFSCGAAHIAAITGTHSI
jgi:hypothetical protein